MLKTIGLLVYALFAMAGCSREGGATQARTDVAADTGRVILDVRGMYCSSCAGTVEAMLQNTDGVVSAVVSVEDAEAVVEFDSDLVSVAQLVEVVQRLGYRAREKPTISDAPAGVR